jgi:hypothetical protein
MQSTTDIVEQAIAKQEAEEAKTDTSKKDDKETQDDKTKDAGAGKSGASDSDKPADDAADDSDKKDLDKDDDKKADDEGTFTADDALEVDAPVETPPATDMAGIQLSPAESKHIADNIGEPIVIRGIRGEGENAKEVELKAYSWQDIPRDFKFASDADRGITQSGFDRLERKAEQLLGSYRSNQSQTAAQDFEKRENEGIRADVADLQKEGRFAKFKIQPGQSGFDDDPAAKQMSEVLAVMSERNELYLKQYEQGRPYKHIGFAEAFDLWERANPAKQAEKKADDDQKKEDDERKRGAERSDSNRGMSSSNIVKPTVKAGTTTRDILARLDADDSW